MPADTASVNQPPDAALLLHRARRLSEDGDPAAAAIACDRAIAEWPEIGDAFRFRVDLARAAGDRAALLDALQALVRHDSEDAGNCATLGAMLLEDAAFERAAAVLRPLASRPGDRGGAMQMLAVALSRIGATEELLSLAPAMHRLAKQAPAPYAPYAQLATARLAALVDRDILLARIATLQSSPRWLGAEAALSALSAAIDSRRPFSLLRLDPSLAVLVAACGRNAARVLGAGERSALIDSVWRDWFGGSSVTEAATGLADDLARAVEAADLVALPGAEALALDPARFGALAEMHRQAIHGTDALFADIGVVERMHRLVPYLRTALAALPFLGFVGAHPAMFRKLAHFCGIKDTRFLTVPREPIFPVAEEGLDPRVFLPDGHAATLDGLSVPHPGAVFLVSAPGPLGIVYAARIKALGGIGIDIGPLASLWAGG